MDWLARFIFLFSHGILLPIGCDSVNLANLLEAVFKGDNAVGMNAVVIGEEDNHEERLWRNTNM